MKDFRSAFLHICRMQWQMFSFGDYAAGIHLPDESEVQRNFLTASPSSPQESFPYWARVWPSALILCRYLADHPHMVRGKRVLELGAGLGLPSMVAAREARELWCTDYDPAAVAASQSSAIRNGYKHLHACTFDWTQKSPPIEAELVLMSDVNYEPAKLDHLSRLIEGYLLRGSTIILSTPQRLSARDFVQQFHPYLKDSVTEPGKLDISVFVWAVSS